jgi:hypothetical protein
MVHVMPHQKIIPRRYQACESACEFARPKRVWDVESWYYEEYAMGVSVVWQRFENGTVHEATALRTVDVLCTKAGGRAIVIHEPV